MTCNSFTNKLLRKKSLSEARSMDTPLDRCLSVWHLLFYGIAHMAGAGIYVLTGTIVRDTAGPAASISFLLCGIASIFIGLCYVEFATLIPRAGSCYTFTYVTLGELPAFVVGWTMVSDYIISMASVAKAFSGTIDALANHSISSAVALHLGHFPATWTMLDKTWDFLALALIVMLMLLVLAGANVSLSVNIGLSLAQVLCLSLVAVCAFVYGNISNWQSAGFFPYGISGVLQGSTIAIFAFSGFESISNAAEESRNPRRDLPLALFGCLFIVGFLYVVVTLGISYLELYTQLDITAPFVAAFERHGARWIEFIAAAGTLLATGATKLATMYVIPRVLYALATDGIIFRCFANVNERVKVPLAGLFFGAAISGILALVFNIHTLADMVSMGVLLSYLFVGIDLLVLRYLMPQEQLQQLQSKQQQQQQQQQQQPKKEGAAAAASCLATRKWAEPLLQQLPQLRSRNAMRCLIAAFLIASCLCSLSIDVAALTFSWFTAIPLVVCFCFVLLLLLLLSAYTPCCIDDCYSSPLMPLAPCVTIFVNCVMISRMQYQTWIRFFLWIFVGLLLYFTYGLRNSNAETAVVNKSDYVPLEHQSHSSDQKSQSGNDHEDYDETKPVLSDKAK